MKRFKLQCGTIIKVDDVDAYLLRTKVWRNDPVTDANGVRRPDVLTGNGRTAAQRLSHLIAGGADYVRFKNGDRLDHRRENLERMTRKEYFTWVSQTARATKNLYQLVEDSLS